MNGMNKIKTASLIERLGNLLRSKEREFGSASGLQSVHVQILFYLSQCNRYSNTPGGVTEFIGSTKGTISQSINLLETKEFIYKIPDNEDRRVIHLELTEKGREFIESQFPPDEFSNSLDIFNKEESEVLTKLLTKLLIHLQKRNNGRIFGVCNTCKYFNLKGLGRSHQCGLTQEPLSEDESQLICREYEEAI